MTTTQSRSGRQSVTSRPSVCSGGMAEPMSVSATVQDRGASESDTGGAVPDSATATPTVTAMTRTSPVTRRQKPEARPSASAGSRARRCHHPAATRTATRTTLATTSSP